MLEVLLHSSFLSMQIKLELFSPEIVSAVENKELLSHFRVHRKSAASAQTDGWKKTNEPLFWQKKVKYLASYLFGDYVYFTD